MWVHKYKVLFYVDWQLVAGCIIETYDKDSAEKLAAAKLQDEIKEAENALNAKVNRTFVSQLPDNQHRKERQ
jgi:hypothetical protein